MTVSTDALVARLARVHDLPFSGAVDYLCRQNNFDPRGDWSVLSTADENIILDGGLSDDGFAVAGAILDDKRMTLQALTPFEVLVVYGFDGSRMLGLPLAARPPKGGYRKPHWLPSLVVLR